MIAASLLFVAALRAGPDTPIEVWGQVPWGMTRQDVQALYPTAQLYRLMPPPPPPPPPGGSGAPATAVRRTVPNVREYLTLGTASGGSGSPGLLFAGNEAKAASFWFDRAPDGTFVLVEVRGDFAGVQSEQVGVPKRYRGLLERFTGMYGPPAIDVRECFDDAPQPCRDEVAALRQEKLDLVAAWNVGPETRLTVHASGYADTTTLVTLFESTAHAGPAPTEEGVRAGLRRGAQARAKEQAEVAARLAADSVRLAEYRSQIVLAVLRVLRGTVGSTPGGLIIEVLVANNTSRALDSVYVDIELLDAGEKPIPRDADEARPEVLFQADRAGVAANSQAETPIPAGGSRRTSAAINARWVPKNWGGKVLVTLTGFEFSAAVASRRR